MGSGAERGRGGRGRGAIDAVLAFFDGLDPASEGRNRLPHWQQDVVVMLATYRLADSLPAAVLAEYERTLASQQMSPGVAQAWLQERLDSGMGQCLLRNAALADVVMETARTRDGVDYRLFACVVMPNHVHALFAPAEATQLLAILQAWKSVSAHRLNRLLGRTGTLWQKDYHDRLIRDWGHFWSAARYIHRNPIRSRLTPGEYQLWESELVQRGLQADE